MAGTHWVARRFPVQVGRSAACDLRVEESGVWDRHIQLDFDPVEGFLLQAHPDALVTVNNQPVQAIRLRNGDSIGLGSVQVQFWLGARAQRVLWPREWFVWLLVVAVTAAQIILVYQLLT
jgi:pSer/pThr/pTyr-binding forkhead associated (FHA) protein